jgi:hypothetical protein
MRILAVVVVILLLLGCGSPLEKKKQSSNSYVEQYFDSLGNLTATMEFRDSLKHGLYRRFYENGVVQAAAFFEKGMQYGPARFYTKNGELQREIFILGGKTKIQKERFTAKNGSEWGYLEYILNNGEILDHNAPNGALYYDRNNQVITNLSYYYTSAFPDSVEQNLTEKLLVKVFPGEAGYKARIILGNFEPMALENPKPNQPEIVLIDSTVIYDSGFKEEMEFDIPIRMDKLGWNHITGLVITQKDTFIERKGRTVTIQPKYFLCESVYVKPQGSTGDQK